MAKEALVIVGEDANNGNELLGPWAWICAGTWCEFVFVFEFP